MVGSTRKENPSPGVAPQQLGAEAFGWIDVADPIISYPAHKLFSSIGNACF
jgi:hypothetical protein